jgi:uncharacterized membrane protein HdeD (DUF308 family)
MSPPILAIRGIAAVAFGVAALASARASPHVLLDVMTIFLLVNGAFALVGGLGSSARSMAVEGLLQLGFGALFAAWSQPMVPITLVAAWALVTGAVQLWTASSLHGVVQREWPLALSGVASIVLGAFLLLNRGLSRSEFWVLVGEFAVVWGQLTLIMAWGLARRARTS